MHICGTRLFWSGVASFSHYELPQVCNVLLGEMCLIGPRPEQPEFVYDYVQRLLGYPLRHSVRPGLSGLSQVLPDHSSYLSGIQQKLAYDLLYIS